MLFSCFIIYGLTILFGIGGCKTDDSPGFFLKVTKNVPRLGKRSDNDFDGSLFKNYKIIPRIGRTADSNTDYSTLESWLNEDTYLRQITKRVLMHPTRISSSENELSVVQPVNSNTLIELLDKDAIPRDNVKFVHWKDFDLALQLDMDLYSKVISLGRRPDQRLRQDLNIGHYTPLFGRGSAENKGNDFLLYENADDIGGAFSRNSLAYNRV